MKIESKNTSIIHNMPSAVAMTAELNAVTFRMFSDNIYENKVAAVVREVISNAVDSHKAARQTRDVEVHIPTYTHRSFVVEDFGLGMDSLDFKRASTYCASDKRGSDDAIGGYGVGFKSPFACVSEYQVRIRKNGHEIQYMLFMDNNDEPAIQKLYERETDEPNGVRVEVPVEAEMFDEFMKECEHYLSFFKGVKVVNVDNFKPRFEGIIEQMDEKGYAYSEAEPFNKSVFAVMGGVPYRVDLWDIVSKHDEKYNALSEIMNQNNVFIKFDLGELKVALSRETLSLDSKTKKALETRAIKVSNSIIGDLQERIDAVETIHDKLDVVMCSIELNYRINRQLMIGSKDVEQHMHRPIKVTRATRYWMKVRGRRTVKAASGFGDLRDAAKLRQRGKTVYVIGRFDESEPKSFLNNAKTYIRENGQYKNGHEYLVVDKDFVITQNYMDRISRLYGVTPIALSASELKEMYKVERQKTTANRIKRDDNVVSAATLVWEVDMDTSHIKEHAKMDRVVDASESTLNLHAEDIGDVHWFHSRMLITRTVINLIALDAHLKGVDYQKINLFKSNKSNIKKLERNGVIKLGDRIKSVDFDRLRELSIMLGKGDSLHVAAAARIARYEAATPMTTINDLMKVFKLVNVRGTEHEADVQKIEEVLNAHKKAVDSDYLGLYINLGCFREDGKSLITAEVLDSMGNIFNSFPLIRDAARSTEYKFDELVYEYAAYIEGKIANSKEPLALAS